MQILYNDYILTHHNNISAISLKVILLT